jgi:hypothetical protein
MCGTLFNVCLFAVEFQFFRSLKGGVYSMNPMNLKISEDTFSLYLFPL